MKQLEIIERNKIEEIQIWLKRPSTVLDEGTGTISERVVPTVIHYRHWSVFITIGGAWVRFTRTDHSNRAVPIGEAATTPPTAQQCTGPCLMKNGCEPADSHITDLDVNRRVHLGWTSWQNSVWLCGPRLNCRSTSSRRHCIWLGLISFIYFFIPTIAHLT